MVLGMKKDLFENNVGKIGLKISNGSNKLYNLDGSGQREFEDMTFITTAEGKLYGGVGETKTAWLKTNSRFHDLPTNDREWLLSNMFEYAMTELEDR